MKKLKNIEKVTSITMYPFAYTKCQIGQDWYKNQFEVYFIPDNYYPDYMEVEQFIQEKIEGKELNIEQASRILYDFLFEEYKPHSIRVINHIHGCKTHFDVDVAIE